MPPDVEIINNGKVINLTGPTGWIRTKMASYVMGSNGILDGIDPSKFVFNQFLFRANIDEENEDGTAIEEGSATRFLQLGSGDGSARIWTNGWNSGLDMRDPELNVIEFLQDPFTDWDYELLNSNVKAGINQLLEFLKLNATKIDKY